MQPRALSYFPPPARRYGIFALQDTDRPALLRHMLRLDPEARRLRFGASLPDDSISRIADRLDLRTSAWGLFIWGELVGAAVIARFPKNASLGELAVTLDESARGRGLSVLLVEQAFDMAAARGIDSVAIYYANDNSPMRALASRFPGESYRSGSESERHVSLPAWEQRLLEAASASSGNTSV